MRQLVVETSEGVRLTRPLAGSGSRFAAALLDLGLALAGLMAVVMVASLLSEIDPTGLSGVVLAIASGGALLYLIAMQFVFGLSTGGRSPGKRALGLHVVDRHGQPAAPHALLLRSLLWPLDAVPLPLPVGLFVVATSADAQRLGDLVAGTYVLREVSARAVSPGRPSEPRKSSSART